MNGKRFHGNESTIVTRYEPLDNGAVNIYEVRTPRHPIPCDYVRLVCMKQERSAPHGFGSPAPREIELIYWDAEEWREAPVEVMGAIMGAIKTHLGKR